VRANFLFSQNLVKKSFFKTISNMKNHSTHYYYLKEKISNKKSQIFENFVFILCKWLKSFKSSNEKFSLKKFAGSYCIICGYALD
jgi:hypothetical protein